MKSRYMISVLAVNSLEIFQRLSVVFSRNRLFIKQMKFESSDQFGYSSFNIEIYTDEFMLERVIKQLKKIVELEDVQVLSKNHLQNNYINKEAYLCQN